MDLTLIYYLLISRLTISCVAGYPLHFMCFISLLTQIDVIDFSVAGGGCRDRVRDESLTHIYYGLSVRKTVEAGCVNSQWNYLLRCFVGLVVLV